MIKERYRAYPEYKDSGGVWLGNVPVHWSTSKIGYLSCKTGSGKTPKGGSEVYSDDGVLFLRSQNIYDFGLKIDKNDVVFISENIDAEMSSSRVLAGDILLNITGASIGRTCIVPIDFQRANVNQHVCIIRVPLALQEYVALCLKSTVTKAQIDAAQNGAAREGLNFEQLSKIEIALPENKAEQEQIANFLDHETAKIDTLIEKQQQLIALLMEKRQAVISHAVTKGLNPDVPMKHSGVEWLGEVPAHWAVCRLKHIIAALESGVSVNASDIPAECGNKGVLKTSCVYTRFFRVEENKTVFKEEEKRLKCPVRKWTIVISRMNTPDLVGASALVEQDFPDIFLPDRLWQTVFSNVEHNAKFISYFMMIKGFRSQISLAAEGASSSMQNIAKEDYLSIHIGLPTIDEQNDIAEFISQKLFVLQQLSKKADYATKLLQERRTSLISAAVTGKIDVRNWQPPTTPQNSPENQ